MYFKGSENGMVNQTDRKGHQSQKDFVWNHYTLFLDLYSSHALCDSTKRVVPAVGKEWFFVYDNLLICSDSDISKVCEIKHSSWWFLVLGRMLFRRWKSCLEHAGIMSSFKFLASLKNGAAYIQHKFTTWWPSVTTVGKPEQFMLNEFIKSAIVPSSCSFRNSCGLERSVYTSEP